MVKTVNIAAESVKDWLENLLLRAIENRASDIHFGLERDVLNIRFRIDGLLYLIDTLKGEENYELVISRLKVIAQIDITEHRLPQDGHFEFSHGGRLFNIRVSTFPTIYGEVVVLRILNREDILINLGELGFDKSQLETVNSLISMPYGMILITGPSNSGKTTLLYAFLNTLRKPTNNIITVEDPVELQMEGVRQTQVNEPLGFNFAKAMRSVLRQDPDIIMVGEIRDDETAQSAMQAALTGRLVFSTFHTLDVFAVVSRLIEMGIPRSVIAHAIAGVVSTRLVRKICPLCRASYELTPQERILLAEKFSPTQKFYKGRGCEKCFNSGYFGRTGIFEVVALDDDIRTVIIEKPLFSEMVTMLRKKSIKTLGASAMDKVLEGHTTLEEAIRVTGRPIS